jgi:hypothetical protein
MTLLLQGSVMMLGKMLGNILVLPRAVKRTARCIGNRIVV